MLIDRQDHLNEAVARWRERPWLAVDTEFVREETYWPLLCLIQVGDGHESVSIDTLKLDLTPLLELLEQPQITKLFHAPSQDLEILVRLRGRAPQPLFDTQTAASLIGLGDQIGYAGLVEKRMGVKLDKSLSRTDWSRRPLSAAEIAYAEDDVRYLGALYPALRDEVEAAGRLSWLLEDGARLCRAERYQPQPQTAWQRLKGLARLTAPQQHVAAALAAWREVRAEQRDRPRKWILSDEALYGLADRQPQTLSQIDALKLLAPKTLDRHGDELIAAIAESAGSTAPPLALDTQLDAALKARVQAAMQNLRDTATRLGIPPGLLAPRADVESVVLQAGAADVPLLQGWRREVFGEELLKTVTAAGG